MFQAPEPHLTELSFMSRIARAANTALQIETLLPAVASEMYQALAWDHVVIGLLQPTEEPVKVFADTSIQGNRPPEEGRIDPSDLSLLMETVNPQQISVLAVNDPDFDLPQVPDILRDSGLHTIASIPIQHRSHLFGAIFVGSAFPRTIPLNEHHLLTTVGEMVSVAIARILQEEDARQAERLKSAFFAKVTHEMRTPVTSISGYVRLLQSGRAGDVPEYLHEHLNYMFHSSKTLRQLVDDMLDFSRMEAGYLSVDHLTPVDLIPIIHTIAGMVRPQADERRLTLQFNIDPHLPPVQADPRRIEQVLTNLLSNAIKYTDDGAITIHANQLDDTYVRLSVQDNGIGITPEHQALIFGEYQRIRNRHNLRFAGTGLGLAISRKLVELMGGTMSLQSEFGVGSTFSCDLRIATELALGQGITSDNGTGPPEN
ncbi:MAG: GAF domain-containing sensor histidine kinase [Chloroflexaceae bacterium]|nr:GAF domain-containing sensor histidine kinase [Chloroflexaceae bacterium]